jgi:hypothetical protein
MRSFWKRGNGLIEILKRFSEILDSMQERQDNGIVAAILTLAAEVRALRSTIKQWPGEDRTD